MNIESLRDYCLSFKGVTESFPFGEDTLVFKVKDKIFAMASIDNFTSINLKCDPLKAIELREAYEAVQPGYHMNKKHWNTVQINEDISDAVLMEWIRDSYNLVVAGLPLNQRLKL